MRANVTGILVGRWSATCHNRKSDESGSNTFQWIKSNKTIVKDRHSAGQTVLPPCFPFCLRTSHLLSTVSFSRAPRLLDLSFVVLFSIAL